MALLFSRWLFLVAGLSGLGLLVPLYFMEDFLGRNDPPAIAHPEYFYGFVGVAAAWQVMFLVIAYDPLRFRPAIVPAILEKFSYGFAVLVLFDQGRLSSAIVGSGVMDLAFGLLFLVAFVSLGGSGSLD